MNMQLRQISLYIKTAQLHTFTRKVFHPSTLNKVSESLETKFKDVLVQPKIEKETWESIRKHVIQLSGHPSVVDSLLLIVLKDKKLIDIGISYYQFLAKNNYDLTIATQTYLLQLYEHKNAIKNGDKECILNLYEHLMNKYTSFEQHMSQTLVANLCKIGEWKKAIKVIQKFEANDMTFLHSSYEYLISYLYDCGNADEAYKYLVTSFKRGKVPLKHAYTSYLEYHLKNKDTVKKKIEEMFSFWRQYGINPFEETILRYAEVCNELGWSAKQAKLNGIECTVCNRKLSHALSNKDYERLRKVVEQKLIFNKVYYVSNPTEITQFINFVNDGKPYDIIIDGLNCIYSSYNGYAMLQGNLLYYKQKGKKVLVIARQHVKHMIKKLNLGRLANYFFFEDLSKDDPFILYAAFASGKKAKIISNDFMRQHKFAIDDVELNALFKRWQISQQCIFQRDELDIRKSIHNAPIDGIAHKQLNCWHIPYKSRTPPIQKQIFNSNWFCFNMRP